jgi:hypothetical protein
MFDNVTVQQFAVFSKFDILPFDNFTFGNSILGKKNRSTSGRGSLSDNPCRLAAGSPRRFGHVDAVTQLQEKIGPN